MGSPMAEGRSPEPVVLDLDDDETPPPQRWGRRQSRWVLAGVAVVAVGLTAVLLRPAPRAPVDLEGLRTAPQQAWTDRFDLSRALLAFECGDGDIGLARPSEAGLTLECRNASDGSLSWEKSHPESTGPWLTDLPGSPYLVVQPQYVEGNADDVTNTVLERRTGERVAEVVLPGADWDAGEWSVLVASDKGTLVASHQHAEPGQLEVWAIDPSRPDRRLWTSSLEEWPGKALTGQYGAVLDEHAGYLWDRNDLERGGYGLVLDRDDGSTPEWARDGEDFAYVGEVGIVAQSYSGVRAFDLSTGAELWKKDEIGVTAVGATNAAYLLTRRTEPGGYDPETGEHTQQHGVTRLTKVDPRSGRERWAASFDHDIGVVRQLGGRLVVAEPLLSGSPDEAVARLSVHDDRTGRRLWDATREGALLTGLFSGDDSIIAQFVTYPQSEQESLPSTAVVTYDLRSGEVLWEVDEMWAQVVAGHLVTYRPDGTVTVYR